MSCGAEQRQTREVERAVGKGHSEKGGQGDGKKSLRRHGEAHTNSQQAQGLSPAQLLEDLPY